MDENDLGLDDELGPDLEPDGPADDLLPISLELDEWDLRKGQEVLDESERLQQHGELLSTEAIADFHGCCFLNDPQLLSPEECEDGGRYSFVETLLQSPDYRQLHEMTQLDETSSAIATVHFAEQYVKLMDKQRERDERGEPADELRQEMDRLGAIAGAVASAEEEVQECKDAQEAFGLGPGSDGSRCDPKRISQLFKQVRRSRELRRICELAGKYRRLAQSRQRQKTVHGYDDMVGVVQDGDISRLLPQELAMLDDPIFSDDAYRRLAERQMMCREYQGSEPVARGPIMIVLDESGSLAGEKIYKAKALALALAWIARKQNRWCCLIAYSGDSGERLLTLQPGKWDEILLMHWLSQFIGRGSDLDLPLRELPGYYRDLKCPPGKTDVIMVTDGVVRIPSAVRAHFLEWKREVCAKVISIIVGTYAGPLAEISDEVHEQSSLDISGEAVSSALSI